LKVRSAGAAVPLDENVAVIGAVEPQRETPVTQVLLDLLPPALGEPPLRRQLLGVLPSLPLAPIEDDLDLLGAGELLSQEVVEVGWERATMKR